MRHCVLDDVISEIRERLLQQCTHQKSIDVFVANDQN